MFTKLSTDFALSGQPAERLSVAVEAPLDKLLDYLCPVLLPPGSLVQVPLGRQRVVGIVVPTLGAPQLSSDKLKPVSQVLPLPALSGAWLELTRFVSDYYLHPWGEVACSALPLPVKLHTERVIAQQQALATEYAPNDLGRTALLALPNKARVQKRLAEQLLETPLTLPQARALHPQAKALLEEWQQKGWLLVNERSVAPLQTLDQPPTLNAEQQHAVEQVDATQGFAAFTLFGVTGSGKTEVYLELARRALQRSEQAQVLVLVPEINLTPQLVARFQARFGKQAVAVQHSGLAEGERAQDWLAAHLGHARVVLGTRLCVLSSVPHLALILVDEEHDSSYKQQDGARYHARDVAVWRAKNEKIPIVLGSATPSLETWQNVKSGHYRRLDLTQRATPAQLPKIEIIDIRQDPLCKAGGAFGEYALGALQGAFDTQQQSLVFINRRGYAPVLQCSHCDWVSSCQFCDAFRVFHLHTRTLQCHHCGHVSPVPRACPDCGNLDLKPMGRGTERTQEELVKLLPKLRIARLDADVGKRKGQVEALLTQVHVGDVDLLVGTQMITKGHDFQKVAVVVALNVDNGLFSHDFRASERLFAQLMQAAGRAGRADGQGRLIVQTRSPQHPLFQALLRHDYESFADSTLRERAHASTPPFCYFAMLTAQHREMQRLQEFMDSAQQQAKLLGGQDITVYSPVPMPVSRVAQIERMQILIEATRRPLLHRFLAPWNDWLAHTARGVRWALDVDPQQV